MEGFTDKQNEVFGKLFGELKKRKPLFDVKAHTIIDMDDENFIKLYTDPMNEITGDDEDIELCRTRALFLNCH